MEDQRELKRALQNALLGPEHGAKGEKKKSYDCEMSYRPYAYYFCPITSESWFENVIPYYKYCNL